MSDALPSPMTQRSAADGRELGVGYGHDLVTDVGASFGGEDGMSQSSQVKPTPACCLRAAQGHRGQQKQQLHHLVAQWSSQA